MIQTLIVDGPLRRGQLISGNEASASTLALLGAKNADGTAFVLDARSVIMDDGKALGTKLTTIEADFRGITGSVETLEEVLIDPTGATVRSVNKLDANGYISGTIQTNNGSESEFNVIANKFKVVDPTLGGSPQTVFAIENGEVTIPNATVGCLKYSALVPLLSGNQNQLNANAGYQILPGGFIIQWGQYRATINSERTIHVTFPTPFLNAIMSVSATAYVNSSNTEKDMWVQTMSTRDKFGADFYVQSATANNNSLDGFDWIAFGF
ncbi:DUF1983 domain-containing protein [Sphingomonas sp. PB2P19]|uniref:gp53-like domain-containing protein n=1 Tax=Sphingomonas rhamnosi TaxID=3096156 RepID=UPI002FCB27CB